MQISDEQHLQIRWSMLHEPGDALAHRVFSQFGVEVFDQIESGSATKLWAEYLAFEAPEYLGQLSHLIERINLRLPHANPISAIERGIRWGAKPVFLDEIPVQAARLSDLGHHAPYLLWVAGDPKVLDLDFVGVVGTRNPSEQGLKNVAKVVRQTLSPIVSGGARGIDAKAHQCALDQGLPTVAFMAGGLDRAYPMENWELFHKMVRSGGALVSELTPGASPSRFRFLQRNRLIAATCDFLVIPEAGLRSGSRNTANHARSLGRDVYAVGSSFSDNQLQGCASMIKEGVAMPWEAKDNPEPSMDQKRVLDAIAEIGHEPAAIARESGLNLAQVIRELRSLRLSGEIV